MRHSDKWWFKRCVSNCKEWMRYCYNFLSHFQVPDLLTISLQVNLSLVLFYYFIHLPFAVFLLAHNYWCFFVQVIFNKNNDLASIENDCSVMWMNIGSKKVFIHHSMFLVYLLFFYRREKYVSSNNC